ncbi:MATE family efflux transporter [Loktanella salsilacus]|uniref:MATE family efflux transporter n=1 Tax=Loktanella salsilacus TaxID=195913 RepID=UPI0037362B91
MTEAAKAAPIPTTWNIFQLAWPLTLKAMMLHGIVVTDSLLVAALGEEALAAMGLAAAIGTLLLGILLAFSNATQIRVAVAFGANHPVDLKSGFYCGLAINLCVALIGIIAVYLFAGGIVEGLAHTPDIAAQAQRYLGVFMFVVLSEAVCQCLSGHFDGSGQTRVPFYSYLIAVPANVLCSVVLIHGLFGLPQMGLTGAAVGSAVSSVLRAVFLGTVFYRQNHWYRDVTGWRQGSFWTATKRHLVFALPIAATFGSSTVANSAAALIYAKMSVNQFAAMTLIMPWVQIAGTIGITWAQATGIIVAQLLGKAYSSASLDIFLRRAWRIAFVAAALVSVTYLIVCLASGWIYQGLQAETKSALFSFLPVLLLLPFPKGSNAICGNTLRAGGDTIYVMNIFVGGQWLVRIPLTAIMVLYFDLSVTWVFTLLLVEELVKFPAFHMRLFKGKWKTGEAGGA